METSSQEFERKQTRGILPRFIVITLFVPLAAFALVWLYVEFAELTYRKSDWKRVTLCIWLGTLLVLVREAYSAARTGARRGERPASSSSKYELKGTPLKDWESKNSRRVARRFWAAALMVPLFAVPMILGGAFALDLELSRSNWKMIVLIVWIGTMLALGRSAWQVRSAGVGYRQEQGGQGQGGEESI